jgi:hypothetical protein
MKLFSILNDIEFKGNKTNILLKWVVGVAGSAVVGAFVVGQLKMTRLNKLDDIEALAKQGVEETAKLRTDMERGFENQNKKIDNIYIDGMEAFEEYRLFNNDQLKLIIDYGEDNKELLKKMLEMNSREKAQDIENDLNKSKRDFSVGVKQNIKPSVIGFTEVETGKAFYKVSNAPENFLDTLDLSKYKITSKEKNKNYPELYDFEYEKK